MKYSLASRELIADCVETMLRAHCFDGVVCIPIATRSSRHDDGGGAGEYPGGLRLRRPDARGQKPPPEK